MMTNQGESDHHFTKETTSPNDHFGGRIREFLLYFEYLENNSPIMFCTKSYSNKFFLM